MNVILGDDRVFISADEERLPSQFDVIVPFLYIKKSHQIYLKASIRNF